MSPRRSAPEHRAVIAALLRRLRADAGLVQSDVARRLDRPQSYVSRVEAGETLPDLVELRHLLAVLGSSLPAFALEVDEALDSQGDGTRR